MRAKSVFGRQFAGKEWGPWRAFVAACFGLGMSPEMLETFRACTGRQEAPTVPAREAWCVVGRRGGKSLTAALLATWMATRDYRRVLAPGEMGVLPVVATDRRQARVVLGYLNALLDGSPLAKLVVRRTAES